MHLFVAIEGGCPEDFQTLITQVIWPVTVFLCISQHDLVCLLFTFISGVLQVFLRLSEAVLGRPDAGADGIEPASDQPAFGAVSRSLALRLLMSKRPVNLCLFDQMMIAHG